MADTDPYFSLLTSALQTPERFKLCVVCGNIVDAEAEECTYCGAYRFETDPDQVSNAALDQAAHKSNALTHSMAFEE